MPLTRNGWYRFRTIMPGRRADNASGVRLPHINMMLLASGIMRRLTTTVFFGDERAGADDPVLAAVPLRRAAACLRSAHRNWIA